MRTSLFAASFAVLNLTTVTCLTHILTALLHSVIDKKARPEPAKLVVDKLISRYAEYRECLENKKPTDGKLMIMMDTVKQFEAGLWNTYLRFDGSEPKVSSRPAHEVIVQCLITEEDEWKQIPSAFNAKELQHENLSLLDRVILDCEHELQKVESFYGDISVEHFQSSKAHALFATIEYLGLDGFKEDGVFVKNLVQLLKKVSTSFVSMKRKTLEWESRRLAGEGRSTTRDTDYTSYDEIIPNGPHKVRQWTIADFNQLDDSQPWQKVIINKHRSSPKQTVKTKGRFASLKYSEAGNHIDSFLSTFKYSPTSVIIDKLAPLFRDRSFSSAPDQVRFTLSHLANHLYTFTHDLLAYSAYSWTRCYKLTAKGCTPLVFPYQEALLLSCYWKEMVIARQIQCGATPAFGSLHGRVSVGLMVASVHYAIRGTLLRFACSSIFSFPDIEVRDNLFSMFERNMAELHVIKAFNGEDSRIFKTMLNSYIHHFNTLRICGKMNKQTERGT